MRAHFASQRPCVLHSADPRDAVATSPWLPRTRSARCVPATRPTHLSSCGRWNHTTGEGVRQQPATRKCDGEHRRVTVRGALARGWLYCAAKSDSVGGRPPSQCRTACLLASHERRRAVPRDAHWCERITARLRLLWSSGPSQGTTHSPCPNCPRPRSRLFTFWRLVPPGDWNGSSRCSPSSRGRVPQCSRW